ncbi:MAG: hypothetical protein U0270_09750 [Labilithrix sp.]
MTGKRTVTVSYASDADMLPHEHEDMHRDVVEKLVEGGIAKPGDDIVVDREGTGKAAEVPAGAEPHAETERRREGA